MKGRMPFPDPFTPLTLGVVAVAFVVQESINGWIWMVTWIHDLLRGFP